MNRMMRRLLAAIVTLIWGLWFGGLLALFLSVTSLFQTFADRHDIAAQAATALFHKFNACQLAVAATALVATVLWRIAGPPRLKEALFILFALATVAACVITVDFTPKLEALSARHLTQSAEFARLHGQSMMIYSAQTLILLIAGLMLPWINGSGSGRVEKGQ